MIVKEARGARWAIAAGLALVALSVAQVATTDLHGLTVTAVRQQADAPIDAALRGQISLAGAYIWGSLFEGSLWFIALAGVILGARLIASEVSSGSVLLLLSRPVGRTRVLLTKFGVAAGAMLGLSVLCGVAALIVGARASAVAPPLGGWVASVLLLWLAGLFVIGVTLVWSVVVPNALAVGFLGFFSVYAIVIGPIIYNRGVHNIGGSDLSLSNYWGSLDIYAGAASPIQSLLVSLAGALIPLLVALALFRRKAF